MSEFGSRYAFYCDFDKISYFDVTCLFFEILWREIKIYSCYALSLLCFPFQTSTLSPFQRGCLLRAWFTSISKPVLSELEVEALLRKCDIRVRDEGETTPKYLERLANALDTLSPCLVATIHCLGTAFAMVCTMYVCTMYVCTMYVCTMYIQCFYMVYVCVPQIESTDFVCLLNLMATIRF